MKAALLAALAVLVASSPAGAAPVRVGSGPLLSLAAQDGTAFAVVERDDDARPLSLVRTTGRSASRGSPFGETGAEFPDLAVGRDGVVVSWGRKVSGGQQWAAARVDALSEIRTLGLGTGPGRLALAGAAWLIGGPDRVGDAVLVTAESTVAPGVEQLSATAPFERHLPMDLAMIDATPVLLDLVQQPRRSVLRVLGARAPERPVARIGRMQTYKATLAVSGATLRVAYRFGGRAYLATARAEKDATWRVRRLRGRGGGEGAPAVAPGGEVLYTQRGSGGHDVYLASGSGVRRLARTASGEEDVHLSADTRRGLWAGWTRRDRRSGRTHAVVQRIR